MIKIQNLDKSFKDKIIFSKASIKINKNMFIGIKGQSGIGKTTFLTIVGLLEEYNGEYYIDDICVDKKNKNILRQKYFSYVFQKSFLVSYLNVYDNLIMSLRNEGKEVDNDFIMEVAKFLGIDSLLKQMPNTLSSGESQRVSIGRAIISGKKIILADEPTGNLDYINSIAVMDIFKSIIKKYDTTIIMVTHSNNMDSYFDSIYEIKDGLINEL